MAPVTGQAHLDIALAVLTAAGGLIGWTKKRSTASLVAGLSFGAAYGASAHLIQNVDAYKGHLLGTTTSAVLSIAMGTRFAKTRKFMPAGLLAAVGVTGFLYHFRKTQEWA